MKVALPQGNMHGWGVAGENLSRELSHMPYLEGTMLHGCTASFRPGTLSELGKINIAYCFFELDIEALRHTRRAAKEWDAIVAGSRWCEYHLRIGGVEQTCTIYQGIDQAVFSPAETRPVDGRFIVFSGGKFELRKSQDIVIAAMRVFMQRHSDAWLSCAWHNFWPSSMTSMAHSQHIRYRHHERDVDRSIMDTLHENGIPLERVILNPPCDNSRMHSIYTSTDIGLFPNRCEGGTNLVMCEYMSSCRPVIASDMTGQRDVIRQGNSMPLTEYSPRLIEENHIPLGVWFEPCVEEVIESLEYAYRHRELLDTIAYTGAEDMKRLTWAGAARQFHFLANRLALRHEYPSAASRFQKAAP